MTTTRFIEQTADGEVVSDVTIPAVPEDATIAERLALLDGSPA